MKKIHIQIIFSVSVVFSLFGINNVMNVRAQSFQTWSPPINLSNSGASLDPSIVIDQKGVIHVIWVDEFDGYKYTQSKDGITWISPKTVVFPFTPKANSAVIPKPTFIVNPKGSINIFWRDEENVLFYTQTLSENLGDPTNWDEIRVLAKSALDFDIITDDSGIIHLSYVNNLSVETNPAGIYYRRLDIFGWSESVNLYKSEYFRSLIPDDSHVRITVSGEGGEGKVYVVWDDRPQKRIYMAKSLDGGGVWESPVQIKGPEDSSGIEIPYNINLSVNIDRVILMWQLGLAGSRCTQYSQLSLDGGGSFEAPVRMMSDFAACPQQAEFIEESNDFSTVFLKAQDDFSLIAWNGTSWSDLQTQDELSTFINPATFESVLLGCQNLTVHEKNLFVVGCDKGGGGDIWFSSRVLGSIDEWFRPPSAWSSPQSVTSIDQNVSSLISVAEGKNNIHDFWVQTPISEKTDGKTTIQYARWDGGKWSTPIVAIGELDGKPLHLTAKADNQGRLIVAWVDGKTGDILFSWANADQASRSSEWREPLALPIPSSVNSSPDILVDAAGRIVVLYAVPINEERGIYFIESEDFGTTWSQPSRIFDALSAGWEIVDQPKASLTGDGRLHILFGQYAMQGDQRRSTGLYYSQSADGGVGWSKPEMVSEQSISWSEIIGVDELNLHRLWQENIQSTMVNFHQVSHDGGVTWSLPANISSISADANQVAVAMDQTGGLHFFQLSDKDELSVLVQKWDGSRWSLQEPAKVLSAKDPNVHVSFTAAITTKGFLLTSILVDYPSVTSGVKDNILSMGLSLGLPENVQASFPVLMSTPAPTKTLIGEVTSTPTQTSPLANLTDNSSTLAKGKNIVGFLLLGGILILVLIVFRPKTKSQDTRKAKSE